jgi:ribosome-binding protein aMBF1 (putative translation factor)
MLKILWLVRGLEKGGQVVATDFRAAIKKRLEEKKMSIPQLARKVELNPQTVYNYLAGKSEMTSVNIEKIFDVLEPEK